MIYRLNDVTKVIKLFNNWEETMIWSCLQNIMGDIYVDDFKHPKSAVAIIADFAFFVGTPQKEFLTYNYHKDFLIMVPQSQEWEQLIYNFYGNKAKRIVRYAFKKNTQFNIKYLENIVEQLPSTFTLQMIDEKLYHICQQQTWSQDLVSQFENYEKYQQLGIGVMILKDNIPIAGASSYTRYQEGIEIEIDTKEKYRRQGLASICGAKLILECLKRHLYPNWDAHNLASATLAKKLGYEYSHEYIAFEINI